MDSGEQPVSRLGLQAHVLCCDYSAEGGLLLAGARNGSLRVLNGKDLEVREGSDPPGTDVSHGPTWDACASCAVSVGRWPCLLTGTEHGAARFYDPMMTPLFGFNEEEAQDPAS